MRTLAPTVRMPAIDCNLSTCLRITSGRISDSPRSKVSTSANLNSNRKACSVRIGSFSFAIRLTSISSSLVNGTGVVQSPDSRLSNHINIRLREMGKRRRDSRTLAYMR